MNDNIDLKIILKNGQSISCNFIKEAAAEVVRRAIERTPGDVITIFNAARVPSGMILVDEIAAVLTPA